MRSEAQSLWQEVEAYNVEHGVADDPDAALVWFYFGQYVEPDLPEGKS